MASPPSTAALDATLRPDASPWAPEGPPLLLANWTQRAFAGLLDFTILLGVYIVAEPILAALYSAQFVAASVVFFVAASFAYSLAFTATGGRTPGKRLLRIRTASLDGSRPNGLQSLLEALSKAVPPFLAIDILAGLAASTVRKQRLVQRAGGLVVLFDPPQLGKRVVFVP